MGLIGAGVPQIGDAQLLELFGHVGHAVQHGAEHAEGRRIGGEHLKIRLLVAADVAQLARVHGSLHFVDIPAAVFLGGHGHGVQGADGIDQRHGGSGGNEQVAEGQLQGHDVLVQISGDLSALGDGEEARAVGIGDQGIAALDIIHGELLGVFQLHGAGDVQLRQGRQAAAQEDQSGQDGNDAFHGLTSNKDIYLRSKKENARIWENGACVRSKQDRFCPSLQIADLLPCPRNPHVSRTRQVSWLTAGAFPPAARLLKHTLNGICAAEPITVMAVAPVFHRTSLFTRA